jgi:hypothetical protein
MTTTIEDIALAWRATQGTVVNVVGSPAGAKFAMENADKNSKKDRIPNWHPGNRVKEN